MRNRVIAYLIHNDVDGRLPVLHRRVRPGLAARDSGVALNEHRHLAALQLDTQGERSYVKQQEVGRAGKICAARARVAGREDVPLHSRANRNRLLDCRNMEIRTRACNTTGSTGE